jgi:hypothetical protein
MMPVTIDSFAVMPEDEFEKLRQRSMRTTHPALDALLTQVDAGQTMRVALVDGQSARGLRTAISRVASSRGIAVETVTGDSIVAAKKVNQPKPRNSGTDSRRKGQ